MSTYVVHTDSAIWAVDAESKDGAHEVVRKIQPRCYIDERLTEKVNALKVIKVFDPGDVGIY